MIITPRAWSSLDTLPEDESCEACDEACDYCCNKRPVQTWFIVLTLWATAITFLIYLSAKQNHARKVPRCPSPLDLTDDTNAEIVLNYPLGDSSPYLPFLGLVDKWYSYTPKYSPPIIVTVTTQKLFADTYRSVQNLRSEILPQFSDMKLVIFHINLTVVQQTIMKDACSCELRKFPFEKFPSFVKDHTDVWQPLAVQLLLREYHFIIWMSQPVPSPDILRKAIAIANKTGIATSYNGSSGQTSLADSVEPKILEALGEVQCAFKDVHIFNTSLLLVYEDDSGYVSRYIMRPWVSCALTDGCMSSGSDGHECSETLEQCNNGANLVLSIILHRLYYNDFRDKGKFPFEIS